MDVQRGARGGVRAGPAGTRNCVVFAGASSRGLAGCIAGNIHPSSAVSGRASCTREAQVQCDPTHCH